MIDELHDVADKVTQTDDAAPVKDPVPDKKKKSKKKKSKKKKSKPASAPPADAPVDEAPADAPVAEAPADAPVPDKKKKSKKKKSSKSAAAPIKQDKAKGKGKAKPDKAKPDKAKGKAKPDKPKKAAVQPVHKEDIFRTSSRLGIAYNVLKDGKPHTKKEVMQAIARKLGKVPWPHRIFGHLRQRAAESGDFLLKEEPRGTYTMTVKKKK